jgi:hypothetical protein
MRLPSDLGVELGREQGVNRLCRLLLAPRPCAVSTISSSTSAMPATATATPSWPPPKTRREARQLFGNGLFHHDSIPCLFVAEPGRGAAMLENDLETVRTPVDQHGAKRDQQRRAAAACRSHRQDLGPEAGAHETSPMVDFRFCGGCHPEESNGSGEDFSSAPILGVCRNIQ